MHQLICHPDTPARTVTSVEVDWNASDADAVLLTFRIVGDGALIVPDAATPARADGLWKTTCCEMFWQAEGDDGYIEVNLSPSSRWAVYAFDRYRTGMRAHEMAVEPHTETTRGGDCTCVEADLDFSTFPGGPARIALSAVIEETDGTKSYWALRHPPGPPDFHHPDCFALRIPALG